MVRVSFALRRVVEVMRHIFQCKWLWSRPGEDLSSRRQAPGLQIGNVRGQRPQGVFRRPLAGQMLQGVKIGLGEQTRDEILPLEGDHGNQRAQAIARILVWRWCFPPRSHLVAITPPALAFVLSPQRGGRRRRYYRGFQSLTIRVNYRKLASSYLKAFCTES